MARILLSLPVLLGSLCLLKCVTGQDTRQYTVLNNCPSSVDLYIAGSFDSTLATGTSTTKSLGFGAGFFYTDANGGSSSGAGTRAGFYGDNNSLNYYIVKDVNHFNTGISITPNHPAANGFCPVARCDDAACSEAFPQPPTGFPPPSSTPPASPVFACPFPDMAVTITFCPSGTFPPNPDAGVAINPNFNTNKCLDVRGAVYANGTPVQIYDCNNSGAQRWVISQGSTKVRVAGTNFCLDAGSSPANGVGMKIWQCYDGLAAQQWDFDNNHLLLSVQNQCLDLPNAVLVNSNQVQTWQCSNAGPNQVWTVV